jgi:hypothetical protein
MRHLKYIFENKSIGIDIDLVKDIIIELKDEYNYLEGGIYINDNSLEIRLNCENIQLGDKSSSLDYINKKFKFIELIIAVSERLKLALGVDVKIQNLYDFESNFIKIWLSKSSN